jgi:hypothetical protein
VAAENQDGLGALQSRNDFERLLAKSSREFAKILAVRAALRVFPLVGERYKNEINSNDESIDNIYFLNFRRSAFLWLASLSPSYVSELQQVAQVNATRIQRASKLLSNPVSHGIRPAPTHAERAAQAAYSAVQSSTAPAEEAAAAVAYAAFATDGAGPFDASSRDALGLATGNLSQVRFVTLWVDTDAPPLIAKSWRYICDTLESGSSIKKMGGLSAETVESSQKAAERASQWRVVWLDWYEAVRDGRAPWGLPREVSEQLLVKAMLWPQDEWDQGSKHINGRIAGLIDAERQAIKPPPEPDPGPGPVLTPTPNGFETTPTPPTVSERADRIQISLHQAILRHIGRLDPEIIRIKNTHRLLYDEFVDYATFVANSLVDVDVPTIWSTGGALIDMIGRLEAQFERAQTSERSSDLDELPNELIMASLTQLARDHAAFVMGFTQGRELAARAAALRQLGPSSREHGRRAKDVLNPMLSVAGLLAERAGRMIGMIDRALDASDEKTIVLAGAATAVATRSIVSFGRALAAGWLPLTIASAVVGTPVDITMKLSGDPNWETIRAAMIYLRDNASALSAFASHDPVMRRWLEWLIEQIKLHGSALDNDPDGKRYHK